MSEAVADHPSAPGAALTEPDPESSAPVEGRRDLRALAFGGMLTAAVLGGVWLNRDSLADRLIASQLRDLGLPATYQIARIGPGQQILRNIVIGDPRHPDLTIEQAEIELTPRLGWPTIGRVRLLRPRLYGTWQGARFSMGTLDRLFQRDAKGAPGGLPEIDLTVVDGGMRIVGDHGQIGLALSGQGRLRSGFAGTLAATAPGLAAAGCVGGPAQLFGQVTTVDARPAFSGTLRAGLLACGKGGVRQAEQFKLATARLQIMARADPGLDGGEARIAVQTGAVAAAGLRAQGVNGTIEAAYRRASLTARYDLIGRKVAHPQLAAGTLALAGLVRARGALDRFETEGTLGAGDLRIGAELGRAWTGLEQAGAGTLAAPLLRQARAALDREGHGSRFTAGYVLRKGGEGLNLVLPQGRLTGGSGATLLALSRLRFASAAGTPRLAGNFTTNGAELPHLTGRLEDGEKGRTRVTIAMADYRAGAARLAIPQLTLVQERNGALTFSGRAVASGALPGGHAENLALPLDGARSTAGDLALWRGCTELRFDALTMANLAIDQHAVTLCPAARQAILTSDRRGTSMAAGTPALLLTGRLGETPVRIASGPAGYAWHGGQPGRMFVSALDVALGPLQTASRFRVTNLDAVLGRELKGTFAGGDVRLSAVPLNLLDANGAWQMANGILSLSDGAFRIEDRAVEPRFEPLVTQGARLTLSDNVISAKATLFEPKTRREVTALTLRHDLASGRGRADLQVARLAFDKALQPDMLSKQLLGVVANVQGTIGGAGQIDWTAQRMSSTGRFTTSGLDLAAAFGPAQGIVGTVEFTDLLGLVTAPHQRLAIAAINPGIEVAAGELLFQLKPDGVAAIEGGHWPLLGGSISLRPGEFRMGLAETRRFVIDIEALDAARFLTQMELANISATGTFDGTLPLVFDQNGGRIEGGLLVSRPPGGSLSYVGALTYKDLSPMANFAFDALKSLDYRTMQIGMDGALEGEIVTRVRFDGVKQGAGAKRNFLTRRLASLPLQFNVNLRAPFYGLINSFKAMYDQDYLPDPRTLGLIDAQGRPMKRPSVDAIGQPIQPPVSETKP